MGGTGETNGLAIASLATSIIGLAPVAIICGHLGLGQIKRSSGRQAGRGLAIAGLVIGYLEVAIAVLVILLMVFVVRAVDDATNRTGPSHGTDNPTVIGAENDSTNRTGPSQGTDNPFVIGAENDSTSRALLNACKTERATISTAIKAHHAEDRPAVDSLSELSPRYLIRPPDDSDWDLIDGPEGQEVKATPYGKYSDLSSEDLDRCNRD